MKLLKLANDDFNMWVEQDSSIQIKAITKMDDPVELSDTEVKRIVEFLQSYLENSA